MTRSSARFEMVRGIADAGRKAAKDKLKEILETRVKDPEAVKFTLELFDNSFDLVEESIANGGHLSKQYIASYFLSKANSFAALSQAQHVQCVGALVGVGVDLMRIPEIGSTGPVGWAAYAAFLAYDGLQGYMECSLAYDDWRGAQQVAEFEKQLAHQRARRHAQTLQDDRQGNLYCTDPLDTLLDNDAQGGSCGLVPKTDGGEPDTMIQPSVLP